MTTQTSAAFSTLVCYLRCVTEDSYRKESPEEGGERVLKEDSVVPAGSYSCVWLCIEW